MQNARSKDSITILKSFDFSKGSWKLLGEAYGGKYVSFKLKENGVKANLSDHFMIQENRDLEIFKRGFLGKETKHNGTTGEIILRLVKDDKVVWEGSVFLFKGYCILRTGEIEYSISYKALNSLVYSKPISQSEYSNIVFKK